MSAVRVLAGAVPTTPVGRWWTARFTLAWLGAWTASLVPIQLALPDQLSAIDYAHRVRDFGLLNGLVGLVSIAALPLFGSLSDRTRSRFGPRRTWVLGGVAVYAIGLVLTGRQTELGWLAACWVLAMIGNTMMATGLTAVIADDVPEQQRGAMSAAVYGPQALGVVIGLVAVTSLGAANRYLALAVALVLLTLPFLIGHRDRVEPRSDPIRPRSLLLALYIPVRENPDYTWAFWGRMSVNIGNALGTTYLLFFLRDYLKVPDPDASLLQVVLVYLVATLIATFAGGLLSDRLGRRKIFVAVASTLQAIAGVMLAVNPTFDTALYASALLGAGYGAFMSVDQALITQVLPDPQDRAKDLGTMNIGSVVPQMFGPVLAALLISVSGYRALFAAAGVITVLGTLMVYRIKSVP